MNLSERDDRYVWHPYTQHWNRKPAIPVVRGKGALLIDENGKEYIDGISSWWVNVHGHGNKYIARKIHQQAEKLEQVIFTSFTHKPAVRLAERLVENLPEGIEKIFYSDNGSTATEVAIKMGLQFHSNSGNISRNKILVLENAYHGDTFGAMSISERGIYTAAYQEKLFDVVTIPLPDENNFGDLRQVVEDVGETLACFIYEPLLQGAGGMKMYESSSLATLLKLVRDAGVLLIADEVLTGFYRTGSMFASDQMPTKPDIICLSKALTGGTMALGVTATTNEVFEAFVSADKSKTLFHGHSFTANPLACTAALASLDLFEKKVTIENVKRVIKCHTSFRKRLEHFKKSGKIKNVRQIGTIIALEIISDTEDGYLNNIADQFSSFCLERNVFLRSLGNTLYIMPPYCIKKQELKKIYATVFEFLETI